MGFLDSVVDAITRITDYRSCTTRSGFWYFVLFHMLMTLFYILILMYSWQEKGYHWVWTNVEDWAYHGYLMVLSEPSLMVITMVFAITLMLNMVCFLSLSVRRLHDIQWSGWWVLPFPLVLLALIICLVIISCGVSVEHMVLWLMIAISPYKLFFLSLCTLPSSKKID